MNKKRLASSVVSIVLCTSLTFGGTYALFASEAKANIAVTSANVEVVAAIDGLKLYSMNELQEGTEFENGGQATLDGANLTLNNVSPGDRAVVSISFENKSNISIQYRVTANVVGELKELLVVGNYEESAIIPFDPDGTWERVRAGEQIDGLTVAVELPESVGVEGENKTESTVITFALEAVQGNAVVVPSVTYEPTSPPADAEIVDVNEASGNALTIPYQPSGKSAYLLKGNFNNEKYTINFAAQNVAAASDGEQHVMLYADAEATFSDTVKNVKITFSSIAGSPGDLYDKQSMTWNDRSLTFTVANMRVPNGSISIGAKNAVINVVGNHAKAIDLDASNCTVRFEGNQITADGETKRIRYDGYEQNKQCVYLASVNYTAIFDRNTFINAESSPIYINGRSEWGDLGDPSNHQGDAEILANVANEVVIEKNILSTGSSAVGFMADPVYGNSGTTALNALSEQAKTLAKALLALYQGNYISGTEELLGAGGVRVLVSDAVTFS